MEKIIDGIIGFLASFWGKKPKAASGVSDDAIILGETFEQWRRWSLRPDEEEQGDAE